MDMFTNPDYQGLGLNTKIKNLVFEAANKDNISHFYVTPSQNSYPIIKNKWGYIESFELKHVYRFIKARNVLRSVLPMPFVGWLVGFFLDVIMLIPNMFYSKTNKYEVKSEQSFGKEADILWLKTKKLKNSIIKDKEYLHWRYIENPDNYTIMKFFSNKEISGILVLKTTMRKGVKFGEIVDIIVDDSLIGIEKDIIKYAVHFFNENDCSIVQAWVVNNSVAEKLYRTAGLFLKRSLIKLLLSPDAESQEFYKKEMWTFYQGDGNDI